MSSREQPVPAVSPIGVLVRTEYSAISTGTESDFIGQRRARPGQLEEMPLGYSLTGTVVEAGPGAGDVRVGDRVACGGMGVSNHAEYVSVPRNLFVKLPEGASPREACEVALASCCLHGVRQGEVRLGETVVVQGTGVLGQLSHQFARLSGARTIVVGSKNEMRLRVARELGAGLVVNASAQDPVEAVMALHRRPGRRRGAVLRRQHIRQARRAGDGDVHRPGHGGDRWRGGHGTSRVRTFSRRSCRSASAGPTAPAATIPPTSVDGHDYPIGYVRWTENRNMGEFVRLLAEGRIRVAPMITHEVPFADALSAYELVLGRPEETLAVILKYG